MKLAERILFFRVTHGLTQVSLAEQCGVSVPVIRHLENPENNKCPKPETLRKVFAGMNLDEDEISRLLPRKNGSARITFPGGRKPQTENSMMKFFRRLNPEGQEIALKQLKALASMDELRK